MRLKPLTDYPRHYAVYFTTYDEYSTRMTIDRFTTKKEALSFASRLMSDLKERTISNPLIFSYSLMVKLVDEHFNFSDIVEFRMGDL